MDNSHVEQLIQHIASPNTKVKLEALNIALQLTGTKESREGMRKSGLSKQVLRCISDVVSTL